MFLCHIQSHAVCFTNKRNFTTLYSCLITLNQHTKPFSLAGGVTVNQDPIGFLSLSVTNATKDFDIHIPLSLDKSLEFLSYKHVPKSCLRYNNNRKCYNATG